jgi:predicted transcriptional regulator
MEVNLAPDLEKELNELAAQSGRGTDELVQDALSGYLAELAQTRATLDRRYDDLKSGKVNLIDGEEAFARLKAKTKSNATASRERRVGGSPEGVTQLPDVSSRTPSPAQTRGPFAAH